ncbi:fra a 1-associated protein-like [Phragmites australis]|uniref:fra a 1-associated protein-like n=1 Tax=Phragmites australis TaxID=29695 RepID=UPI002D768DD3|nr:fra a 1-associated protein-like [Phragmites australis]
MGWRWHDDNDDGGRGLGAVPDLDSGGGGDGAQCATRRVVQSRCHTEEVEPGRFVRKCEKTEQLLRDCVGRPTELVESKTENTEEDVTDEIKSGSLSLGFPTKEPFAFPGLRSDMDALEKGFFGSLSSVLDEAERMTNYFFKSFAFPSTHDRESSPFPRRPADSHIDEGTAKKTKESDYSEFSGQISDV